MAGLVVAGFSVLPISRAQDASRDGRPTAATQAPPSSGSTQGDSQATAALTEPGRTPAAAKADYGLWVLTPAIVAILLAIFTRQIVPALVVGVVAGAFMQLRCLPNDDAFATQNTIVGGLRLAAEYYILGAIHQPPDQELAHLKIVILTLAVGFVVGVVSRNGGAEGMVRLVAGPADSPRRGALTTWLAGVVVFFDQYSNTMIVGSTMRSAFDRLRLSRAKLAYIVDSTAASIAAIAIIGTSVGAETGFLHRGLTGLAQPLRDAHGQTLTGMTAFLASTPYRFYPIFALILVFLVCLTGRDFGPMKRSEREAQSRPSGTPSRLGEAAEAPKPRSWLALVPSLVLLLGTVYVLAVTGLKSAGAATAGSAETVVQQPWWEHAGSILTNSNPTLALFYGALSAAVIAVLLTVAARACTARDAVDAGLDGLARMMPAMVILVLAWAISHVMADLHVGDIVAERLKSTAFPEKWLPFAVFISAALVSFTTGTALGTLVILCPITVDFGASLMTGMETGAGATLMYSAIGSVVGGAVFGSHLSPMSDTTVLASIASGCRHEEHVWTQMPYAIVGAVAQIALGNVLCSVYGQPWYVGLGAGVVFLALVVLIFGRRAVPVQQLGAP